MRIAELARGVVFLTGPRQVGKTNLARTLFKKIQYLNWDIQEDRSQILARTFQQSSFDGIDMIVLSSITKLCYEVINFNSPYREIVKSWVIKILLAESL